MNTLKITKILPIATADDTKAIIKGKDMHTKRDELVKYILNQRNRLQSVPEFVATIPAVKSILENLKQLLRDGEKKPKIAVVGSFNAGKSSFINDLLGANPKFPNGDILPVDFVPCTNGATIVKLATEEFPNGTVRILYNGKSSDQRDPIVGGPDLIDKCRHGGSIEGYSQIEVYSNAPLLEFADLIDTPGLNSGMENDDEIAQDISNNGDLIIQASSALQFMTGVDFGLLASVIENLEKKYAGRAFKHLFLVASLWDLLAKRDDKNISDNDMVLLDENRKKKLADSMCARLTKCRPNLDGDHLASRVFPFCDRAHSNGRDISRDLKKQLLITIANEIPGNVLESIKQNIIDATAKIQDLIRAEINLIEANVNDANLREQTLAQMRRGLEFFLLHKCEYLTEMSELTDKIAKNSVPTLMADIKSDYTCANLVRLIKSNWSSKSDAKEGLSVLIQNQLDEKTKRFIEQHGREVSEFVGRTLNETKTNYTNPGLSINTSTVDVDALFLAGLANVGTLGGLAFWAAGLGNLGGYILVAQFTGLLSAIGIGVGGGGAMVSLVAGLGGPITIAIGLAFLAGSFIYWLFGKSWQDSLAEKTEEHLVSKMLPAIKENLIKYFVDTNIAYKIGIDGLDIRLRESLENLEASHRTFDAAAESERRDALVRSRNWPEPS